MCDKIKIEGSVLYVSGEESAEQIKLRADRLEVKNDELLFQMADSYFAFLITRLRNIYHLHQQDLKICLMTLLQYSNKEIMNAIGRSTNSAGKLKNILQISLELLRVIYVIFCLILWQNNVKIP